MQVVNELTGRYININKAIRVVVDHIPGNVIFGYCNANCELIDFYILIDNTYISAKGPKKLLKKILIYSNRKGKYISKVGLNNEQILTEMYTKGNGNFPYSFRKRYEAVEVFETFEGKQKLIEKPKTYNLSKYLRYSIGLEFETSQGYIPEELCLRDGLIPLRDGSISGIEYSTVILNGNSGIRLLHQQLNTLKKYTYFNKECSLHIHFGNYPLHPRELYNLYFLCKALEDSLSDILPEYAFSSGLYKKNGKDYCKLLPKFYSFNNMYSMLVGIDFPGKFTLPHPSDPDRSHKWNISTRYYWVNFINALCYDVCKTIEFRFLRPTYNFNKIVLWIYILNAIMLCAEANNVKIFSLKEVLYIAYPPEISKKLEDGLTRLLLLKDNQEKNGDFIGCDTEFENELFPPDLNY